jgi:hypothetical protein
LERRKKRAWFWWKNLKEGDHSEDLGVDEIIIIKWNLNKMGNCGLY